MSIGRRANASTSLALSHLNQQKRAFRFEMLIPPKKSEENNESEKFHVYKCRTIRPID